MKRLQTLALILVGSSAVDLGKDDIISNMLEWVEEKLGLESDQPVKSEYLLAEEDED